ncbi:MAG: glycosyltransferase family 4 protein, partial [Catenulispora sp.]
MRVLIDTTYVSRAPYSGTAVYLEQLCEALRAGGRIEPVEVANPRRRPAGGGGLGSLRNAGQDAWWTLVELPRLARRAGAQVIHHPLPVHAAGARIPQVITVHDLAFEVLPEAFDRRFRLYAHHVHRAAARASRVVIAVSETTATAVGSLWGIPTSRIVVARHGPGQPLEAGRSAAGAGRPAAGAAPSAAGAGRPAPAHFLYVGDDEPRKNLGTLIAAYGRYREQTQAPLALVLAGSASAVAPGVRVEPQVTRARLAELYAGAAALVHPALYEGFGLSPLEAMRAGTPVLAADAPGVREVCGDGARYADPRDAMSFARAMADLATDHRLREDLGRAGRRRAGAFSWAQCAGR